MIQPSGVELVLDCAMIVVDPCGSAEVGVTPVDGTAVVVATVGSVVGSVVGLVVSGSVVEGSVVEGTSGVVVAGGLTAPVPEEADVAGRVTAGAVADGEVSDRRVTFPPPPQAPRVPARTISPAANQRRPRRPKPAPLSKGEAAPVSAITWSSSSNDLMGWFASPVSNHCLARLAPPDTGETTAQGLDSGETDRRARMHGGDALADRPRV
jgi:hypothetical protein